jgi:hypothetical protein
VGHVCGELSCAAGSADGFELKIRYGTKEVAASELNRTLPALFKRIYGALEKLAGDLKEKEQPKK